LFRLILLFAFALSAFSATAATPAESPEMTAALDALVASQDIKKNWPMIIENSARNGAAHVQQGALERLAENRTLTEQQRQKMTALLIEEAPAVAKEIEAMHMKLDIDALMHDMVHMVYPKYFSANEIRQLAAFYSGNAFKKLAKMQLQTSAESAPTEQDKKPDWLRYRDVQTVEDLKELAAFQNSAVGRKQQAIGAQMSKEVTEFLHDRLDPAINEVGERYGKRVAARMLEIAR
jgi:hypothetical protein